MPTALETTLQKLNRQIASSARFAREQADSIDSLKTDPGVNNEFNQSVASLKAAQQGRVLNPRTSAQGFKELLLNGGGPGVAIAFGALSADADFAEFVNTRIQDAQGAVEIARQNRRDILAQQANDNALTLDKIRLQNQANANEVAGTQGLLNFQAGREDAQTRIDQNNANRALQLENRREVREDRTFQQELALLELQTQLAAEQSTDVTPEQLLAGETARNQANVTRDEAGEISLLDKAKLGLALAVPAPALNSVLSRGLLKELSERTAAADQVTTTSVGLEGTDKVTFLNDEISRIDARIAEITDAAGVNPRPSSLAGQSLASLLTQRKVLQLELSNVDTSSQKEASLEAKIKLLEGRLGR